MFASIWNGAPSLVRDIFIELDHLGPKKWWFVEHCGGAQVSCGKGPVTLRPLYTR